MGIAMVIAALSTCATMGCTRGAPTRQERCEQLLDHTLELRFADDGRRVPAVQHIGQQSVMTPPVPTAAHRAAAKRALGGFVDTCTQQMTDSEIDCLLAATDRNKARICSSAKTAAN